MKVYIKILFLFTFVSYVFWGEARKLYDMGYTLWRTKVSQWCYNSLLVDVTQLQNHSQALKTEIQIFDKISCHQHFDMSEILF